MVDCFKSIYKNEGLFAFYKGTLSPLIGVSACVSVQFGSNEFGKRLKTRIKRKRNPTANLAVKDFMQCGGFSGFCNAFIQGPVEMFRIKMQVQGASAIQKYNGSIDCFQKTFSQFGIKGVYQGLLITICREVPAFTIYFGVYESLMQKAERTYGERKNIPIYKIVTFGGLAGLFLWIGTFPIDVVKSCLQADDYIERKYRSIPHCIQEIYRSKGIGGFFNGIAPCLIRAPPINAATFLTFELVAGYLRKDNKKKV